MSHVNLPFGVQLFNGMTYVTRQYRNITIGDEQLEKAMVHEGNFVSDFAEQVDSTIGYYAPLICLLRFSDEQLAQWMHDNVDEDFPCPCAGVNS